MPSALSEKRNLSSIHDLLATNLGKHSLFSASPKFTASFLSLLWWEFFRAPGADNKVHLSLSTALLPSWTTAPAACQRACLYLGEGNTWRQALASLARHVSFQSDQEKVVRGSPERSRRTFSAAASHNIPARQYLCRESGGCVNSGGQRWMAQHLTWIYHRLLVAWGIKQVEGAVSV